jgi:hypothetical protein
VCVLSVCLVDCLVGAWARGDVVGFALAGSFLFEIEIIRICVCSTLKSRKLCITSQRYIKRDMCSTHQSTVWQNNFCLEFFFLLFQQQKGKSANISLNNPSIQCVVIHTNYKFKIGKIEKIGIMKGYFGGWVVGSLKFRIFADRIMSPNWSHLSTQFSRTNLFCVRTFYLSYIFLAKIS